MLACQVPFAVSCDAPHNTRQKWFSADIQADVLLISFLLKHSSHLQLPGAERPEFVDNTLTGVPDRELAKSSRALPAA